MTISRKVLLSLSAAAVLAITLSIPVSAEAKKTGVVTESGVNFRKSPDLSSKVLDQLEKGTKVSVTDSEGDWFKVIYNDASGWINDGYLVVRDEKIAAGVVSGSVVNVRSKPDISSEVMTKLEKGAKVDIYDHTGDWYKVAIGEERFGWMNKEFLTVKEESVSKDTSDTKAADEDKQAAAEDTQGEAGDAGEIPDATGEEIAADVDANAEDKAENPDLADRGSDGLNAEARKEAALREQIVDYAKTLIGIRYVYGGESKKGFDCSGFVKYVYNHFDMSIARKSSEQGSGGTAVKKANLQPGDLVFFDTNGGLNNITHVGIYIGGGKFIHASTYEKHAITIESLSSAYYSKRYMRARDYISK